jgi:hypothetical protein
LLLAGKHSLTCALMCLIECHLVTVLVAMMPFPEIPVQKPDTSFDRESIGEPITKRQLHQCTKLGRSDRCNVRSRHVALTE